MLRNLTIISLIGSLNAALDEGIADHLSPAQVQKAIADGTILDLLCQALPTDPNFNMLDEAVGELLVEEWQEMMEIYDGREATKMGIEHKGLCILIGYCLEILQQRNWHELSSMKGIQYF